MYCAYALPGNGAIIFRHERRGIRPLAGAVRLAIGDPNWMPRTVFAVADREGARWFVPGARGQARPAFLQACANLAKQIEGHAL